MEVHIERLKHLCRICGQKIVVKIGYISYQGSLNPKTCEEYSGCFETLLWNPTHEKENKEVCVCQGIFPSP